MGLVLQGQQNDYHTPDHRAAQQPTTQARRKGEQAPCQNFGQRVRIRHRPTAHGAHLILVKQPGGAQFTDKRLQGSLMMRRRMVGIGQAQNGDQLAFTRAALDRQRQRAGKTCQL
ncbi:hypothetical protein CUU62_25805 [Pseudomonas sp. WP001]|nr:hypothetical protein CUU62_25805 [Pseudomonas sp. WP001]